MARRCHRLAQITDLHLTADPDDRLNGIQIDASARRVLDALHAWGPDLVVASGDLAERGEPDAYRRLDTLVAQLGSPVYGLLGNHDDPAALAASGTRHLRRAETVTLGNWQLHFVDTWVAGSPGGAIGTGRLEALRTALHAGPVAVFVHHQVVPVGSEWIDASALGDGEALIKLLTGHRAPRIVCCGHVHQAVAGWRSGVRWMTAPSTCSQFRPFHPTHEPDPERGPGFRWLELWEDGRWETGVERIEWQA